MAAETGTIVNDAELKAMTKCSKALDELTPNARKRVVTWLTEREKDRDQPSTPKMSDS